MKKSLVLLLALLASCSTPSYMDVKDPREELFATYKTLSMDAKTELHDEYMEYLKSMTQSLIILRNESISKEVFLIHTTKLNQDLAEWKLLVKSNERRKL